MAIYENINLEKGMYQSGRSLTEILEEMDPSENYKGTALEGLDAFSRQLKRFDIKVSGKGSDTIEKSLPPPTRRRCSPSTSAAPSTPVRRRRTSWAMLSLPSLRSTAWTTVPAHRR